MTPFQCGHCGQTVFFDNHFCTRCGTALAYQPEQGAMLALPGVDTGMATGTDAATGTPTVQACANRQSAGCNWLVTDGLSSLCRSCRLTRVIPDLSVPGHAQHWRRIEQAKRRVIYSLIGLGLGPEPQASALDATGLTFNLLARQPGGPPVLTGHEDGVITINIEEADDVAREQARVAMGEPVRSLLGHLRHEVSHYLQYRWVRSPEALAHCRAVFGDETQDYTAALARHHANGPPADWAQHFISAYASAHPWEDWAETCAHVLLVADGLETASRWGLQLQGPAAGIAALQPLPSDPGRVLGSSAAESIGGLALRHWLPIAGFVNAMNRSLGLPDPYPYLMPEAVLRKMDAVQALLSAAAAPGVGPGPRDAAPPADGSPMPAAAQ